MPTFFSMTQSCEKGVAVLGTQPWFFIVWEQSLPEHFPSKTCDKSKIAAVARGLPRYANQPVCGLS